SQSHINGGPNFVEAQAGHSSRLDALLQHLTLLSMNRIGKQFSLTTQCQTGTLLAFAFLLSLTSAFPQAGDTNASAQLEYTRSHYTKYEYQIPMRDGVKLFTAVYVPKDNS